MKRLTDTFDSHESKFTLHKYFQNEHAYDTIESDLLAAYLSGDAARVTEIAEATELRRVPVTNGYN